MLKELAIVMNESAFEAFDIFAFLGCICTLNLLVTIFLGSFFSLIDNFNDINHHEVYFIGKCITTSFTGSNSENVITAII